MQPRHLPSIHSRSDYRPKLMRQRRLDVVADGVRRPWLRALTAAGLLGTTVLVLAGCVFHNGPPNPDPHNQRLNQLANDPIFAQLPAGATQHLVQNNWWANVWHHAELPRTRCATARSTEHLHAVRRVRSVVPRRQR